jgi:cobalt-zinc-cadmium efflux system outer membrane protein
MEVYMVTLKRFAVGGIFLLAVFGPVLTQSAIRPLSLNELEEIALKINPSLKAAGAEVQKSEADLKIARQYPNPELEGLISSQRSMENGNYATGYTIALSQPVEWPGRRGKKQEAARFGIDVAQNKLNQEQVNVRARCRELYYRVLADEQFLKNAAENLESARKLLNIAEKRVSLGESRPIELVKARVEFLTLEREYDKDKVTLAGDRQILWQFLGEKIQSDFTLAAEPENLEALIPLKRWQESVLTANPQLAAQTAQVRQAESNLGAERQAWLPDVSVKVFRTKDVDLQATGGGLSFPLPLWNRKGGEVAKAAAMKGLADSELQLLKQDLTAKLTAQYSLYETARRQVQSFQANILKEAATSLRVAQFAYEHGETSLLELLDSRRVYRATEEEYYKAMLDYRLARVEIWRLTGGGIK